MATIECLDARGPASGAEDEEANSLLHHLAFDLSSFVCFGLIICCMSSRLKEKRKIHARVATGTFQIHAEARSRTIP